MTGVHDIADTLRLHLSDGLSKFQKLDFYCDLELQTSCQSRMIHSLVFAALSDVYYDMCEEEGLKVQKYYIQDDMDDDIFDQFVNFLYTGSTEGWNMESSRVLEDLGRKHEIDVLVMACQEFKNYGTKKVVKISSYQGLVEELNKSKQGPTKTAKTFIKVKAEDGKSKPAWFGQSSVIGEGKAGNVIKVKTERIDPQTKAVVSELVAMVGSETPKDEGSVRNLRKRSAPYDEKLSKSKSTPDIRQEKRSKVETEIPKAGEITVRTSRRTSPRKKSDGGKKEDTAESAGGDASEKQTKGQKKSTKKKPSGSPVRVTRSRAKLGDVDESKEDESDDYVSCEEDNKEDEVDDDDRDEKPDKSGGDDDGENEDIIDIYPDDDDFVREDEVDVAASSQSSFARNLSAKVTSTPRPPTLDCSSPNITMTDTSVLSAPQTPNLSPLPFSSSQKVYNTSKVDVQDVSTAKKKQLKMALEHPGIAVSRKNFVELFVCIKCNLGFKDKNKLALHKVRFHPADVQEGFVPSKDSKDVLPKCTICCIDFFNKKEAWKHHQDKHAPDGDGFICSHCQLPFTNEGEYLRHRFGPIRPVRRVETKDPDYEKLAVEKEEDLTCSWCGEKFVFRRKLWDHHVKEHPGKKIQCNVCLMVAQSVIHYCNHRERCFTQPGVTKPKNRNYKCPECCFLVDDVSKILVHWRMLHLPNQEYSCEICAESAESFKDIRIDSYAEHMLSKHEKILDSGVFSFLDRFECRKCDFKSYLITNAQTHFSECQGYMVTVGPLSQEQDFLKYKDRKEGVKKDLTTMKMSIKTKQQISFPCPKKNCKSVFGSLESQQTHLLEKHDVVPAGLEIISCPDCEYRTLFPPRFIKHRQEEHSLEAEPTEFKCLYCQFRTLGKNLMRSHHMQKHKHLSLVFVPYNSIEVTAPTYKPDEDDLELFCTICQLVCSDKLDYIEHLKIHGIFKCQFCKFIGQKNNSLMCHYSRVHKGEKYVIPPKPTKNKVMIVTSSGDRINRETPYTQENLNTTTERVGKDFHDSIVVKEEVNKPLANADDSVVEEDKAAVENVEQVEKQVEGRVKTLGMKDLDVSMFRSVVADDEVCKDLNLFLSVPGVGSNEVVSSTTASSVVSIDKPVMVTPSQKMITIKMPETGIVPGISGIDAEISGIEPGAGISIESSLIDAAESSNARRVPGSKYPNDPSVLVPRLLTLDAMGQVIEFTKKPTAKSQTASPKSPRKDKKGGRRSSVKAKAKKPTKRGKYACHLCRFSCDQQDDLFKHFVRCKKGKGKKKKSEDDDEEDDNDDDDEEYLP